MLVSFVVRDGMGLIPSQEQVSLFSKLESNLRVSFHSLHHFKHLFAFLLTPNIFILNAFVNFFLKVITHELLDEDEVEVAHEVWRIAVLCQC